VVASPEKKRNATVVDVYETGGDSEVDDAVLDRLITDVGEVNYRRIENV
jgi:hypothetical protein